MFSELFFSVSWEALKKVLSKQAVFGPGGVRLLDGTIFEMYRPLISKIDFSKIGPNVVKTLSDIASTSIVGKVDVISSLATNVQCAFIQKGVNTANLKLDTVLQRLGNIEKALGALSSINTLAYLSVGLGLANCCISIVGFQKVLGKLQAIDGKISEFYERYKADRQDDRIAQYKEHMSILSGYLGVMLEIKSANILDKDRFHFSETQIMTQLSQTRVFLRTLLQDFTSDRMDKQKCLTMLYTLLPVYSQTFNEFCCLYKYVNNVNCTSYLNWLGIFDEVAAEDFHDACRRYFTLDAAFAEIAPADRRNALLIADETVNKQRNWIETCKTCTETLTFEEYLHIGDRLTEGVLAAVREDYARANERTLESALTEAVENGRYFELDDGTVLITA